jgi:hypothetical protein
MVEKDWNRERLENLFYRTTVLLGRHGHEMPESEKRLVRHARLRALVDLREMGGKHQWRIAK